MEQIINDFLNITTKLKIELQEKKEKLNNDASRNVSANIRKYKLARGIGKIDLEVLSQFIDSLNLDEQYTIDYYKQTYEIINKYSNMIGFEELIKKYQKEFEKLDAEINKKESQLLKIVPKNAYDIKEYESSIKIIDEINNFYKNEGIVLLEDTFDKLIELLKDIHGLDMYEKLEIVKITTMRNANNMQKSINLELRRQQKVEEEKKKERVRKTRKKVVVEKTPVIEEKNAEDILNNEQLVIYNKAKQISEREVSLSENIATIFNSTQNKDISEKIALYSTFPNMDDQVNIIVYDLKTNILPNITKLEDSTIIEKEIETIKKIIDYYDSIINKKELIENTTNLDIKAILREFNLEDKILIIKQAEILLGKCEKIMIENPNEMNANFLESFYNFRDSYNEFYEVLKTYNPKTDGDYHHFISLYIDVIETYLNDLQTAYNQIENLSSNSKLTEEEELLKIGKEFYNNTNNTCMYVFLDNGSDTVPIVYEDIQKDEKLKNIGTANEDILKGMEDFCDDLNSKKYSGRHLALGYDRYSKEFLEKYHIKGLKTGNRYRLFYTRIHSNLQELYGVDMPEVLIVYSVGWGQDSNKNDIYYEALKRCYDNQKWVDNIMDLFNTDIKKLSEEERNNYKEKIEKVLREQYIKMGYFVKKTREKEQELGKSKRKES